LWGFLFLFDCLFQNLIVRMSTCSEKCRHCSSGPQHVLMAFKYIYIYIYIYMEPFLYPLKLKWIPTWPPPWSIFSFCYSNSLDRADLSNPTVFFHTNNTNECSYDHVAEYVHGSWFFDDRGARRAFQYMSGRSPYWCWSFLLSYNYCLTRALKYLYAWLRNCPLR